MANTEKTYHRGSDERYDDTGRSSSRMKVVVRIRPETESEIHTAYPIVVKAVDDHVLVFDPRPDNTPTVGYSCVGEGNKFKKPSLPSKKHKDLRLGFDRVFDGTGTQIELFEHTTKDVVNDLLDGINCSVFAYGATGAGKTYTMLGDAASPGVMFYTMLELYKKINELKDEKICEVGLSYLEIYNETIRDLIVPSGALELREDYNQGLVVSGLTMHQPKTADEILNFLTIGNRNRTQHPTDANASSSRSHAVFQVYVNQKSRTSGVSTMVTQGKLSLIDLAGSERATVTTNRGARLREGANINKSLLALGNCINALAENKSKGIHIPYRNSKLTRLLKDSLGGNCRTVMITNVSPSGLAYEDTYNTLKYADRAQQIKTTLVRNVVNVDLHVTKYRSIIQDLQKEVSELKQKIHLQLKPAAVPVQDSADVIRLEEMVHSVYSERSHLRKTMSDLDAAEREILLRVYRKERDLERIKVSSNCDARRNKTQSQMEIAQSHLMEVQRQKQIIHDRLQSNRDSINNLQREITLAIGCAGSCDGALRRHMEMVIEARKLDVEGAHQWKQIKHLLKYIKCQEKEISKTERLLLHALEVACKQHQLLASSHLGAPPPYMEGLYLSLVRMAEGEKEVLWADQSAEALQDTSALLVQSQRNILDTMVMYSSPTVKKESPLATLGGILTKRSCLSAATELSSSDADSSITGVSCYSSCHSPRYPVPERQGVATSQEGQRPPVALGGAVEGVSSRAGYPWRKPPAVIVEEAGTGAFASRGAFTPHSMAGSAGYSTRVNAVSNSLDCSRVGVGQSGNTSQQTKPGLDCHEERPDDVQLQPGYRAHARPVDRHPPKVSSGSAFRPLSQPPGGASNLLRRGSSLSRATTIRSPPPTRSSHTAVATTDAEATKASISKTLPPPTPHVSAADKQSMPFGFDDNFVSPMVLKNRTAGTVGSSAFSRPPSTDRGNSSLKLSPPLRRTLDASGAVDLEHKDAASSPPRAMHSAAKQSSLPSPTPALCTSASQGPGYHVSPLRGGTPKVNRPPSDLNSTFTIESLPPPYCGSSQGNSSRPLSTPAIHTAAITVQLEGDGQYPSVDAISGGVGHRRNTADSSGEEHHSSTLQTKKAPNFMALTKSATYKRVQSAWTRMNINKENEITAGPVVVRALSKSKRLQSLSASHLGKQPTCTL